MGDDYVEVEGIALAQFIRDLGRRVGILKMDVEGAEVGILNAILDAGLHERIDRASPPSARRTSGSTGGEVE